MLIMCLVSLAPVPKRLESETSPAPSMRESENPVISAWTGSDSAPSAVTHASAMIPAIFWCESTLVS